MTITHTVTPGSPGIPDIHHLGLASIQIFDAEPEYGDRSDMYVFEFAGVSVNIRQRAYNTFVHVEDDDIPDVGLPLVVSVNNGPEMDFGEPRD